MGFWGGSASASSVCERGVVERRVAGWSQRIAVVFLGKVNLFSPKRQMSNVLGPCGLWTERSSQAAGVFTGIKRETLYSEVTDSCASSLWHTLE